MRPLGANKLNAGSPPPGAPLPPDSAGRSSRELLFDSEAILRLVDGALTDLRVSPDLIDESASPSEAAGSGQQLSAAADLPRLVLELSGAIRHLLEDLRTGRQELPARRLQSLYPVGGRLDELSSTAAMLDRLGKALVLVDAVETTAVPRAVGNDHLGDLRHELFSVMNCLQFHSDTVERLNQATTMLAETEYRLAEIAESIDPIRLGSTRGGDPAKANSGNGPEAGTHR